MLAAALTHHPTKDLDAMSTSATALPAPPTGRYIIDGSTSTVTFITKHMFGLGKVRGSFAVTRGVIIVPDQVDDSTVDAEISASSFSTRNFIRDPQVRSSLFLHARRHPTISFRTNGIQRRTDSCTVSGTLTVKGKSALIDLTVTDIDITGASAVFTAHGTIDRYALGITKMRGMAARNLSVEISARAHKA
ncbi:YceI family protein [Streptomyces sp. W16]|uniref:YceI family protein n=1 Tax=Streptomyces sp. W16 TaxID=3076631 RepID=UPI00295B14BE|nr:YceI family protein [Streptomyces sp. W16]MDV9170043.1 YceI family protein [Streptomyces sp. W16]